MQIITIGAPIRIEREDGEFKTATVLNYGDGSANAVDKLAEVKILMTGFQNASSLDEMVSILDKVQGKYNEVISILQGLQVPETSKEGHEYSLSEVKKTVDLIGGMKAALQKQDTEKFYALYASLIDAAAQESSKGSELTTKYLQESKLVKLGNNLKDMQRSLTSDIAKL